MRVFLFLIALAATFYTVNAIVCSDINEEPSDITVRELNCNGKLLIPKNCDGIEQKCCRCKNGFQRYPNGGCVLPVECVCIPPFEMQPISDKHKDCNGNDVEDNCVARNCCRCPANLVFRNTGCIEKSDCPPDCSTCPADQKPCLSCTDRGCEGFVTRNPCKNSEGCCCCKDDLVRIKSACVTEDQCPDCVCSYHEVLCPNCKDKDCDNADVTIVPCAPGKSCCCCREGYVRVNGECVPENVCPKCLCSDPEVPCPTCTDMDCNNVDVDLEVCGPDRGCCCCKDDYVRVNDECIPKTNCSSCVCSNTEIPCPGCKDKDCNNQDVNLVKCGDNVQCCCCKPGYKRVNGECILEGNCNKCVCSNTEIPCPGCKDKDCNNQNVYLGKCGDNVQCCCCKPGYKRVNGECILEGNCNKRGKKHSRYNKRKTF